MRGLLCSHVLLSLCCLSGGARNQGYIDVTLSYLTLLYSIADSLIRLAVRLL